LLPVLIFIAVKKRRFDVSVRAFLIMTISGLLALLTAMSSFGFDRDWDFASIPVLAVVSLSLYLLYELNKRKIIDLRILLPVLLLTGITSSYLWIRINASEASVVRYEHIVERDATFLPPHATYTALENLRKYYSGTNRVAQKHETLKRIITNDYRPWDAVEELLWDTVELKDPYQKSEGFAWILDAIYRKALHPVDENHYQYISRERLGETTAAVIYVAAKYGNAMEVAGKYANQIHSINPNWREFPFLQYAVLGQGSGAAEQQTLESSVATDSEEPILTMAMGDYLIEAGDPAAAIPYYNRTLALAPSKYPDVYFSLARALEESTGDLEQSIGVLEQFLKYCKFDSRVSQVQQLIDMRRQMQP
jgi:tetratricopeptide (TPR) repeat protein